MIIQNTPNSQYSYKKHVPAFGYNRTKLGYAIDDYLKESGTTSLTDITNGLKKLFIRHKNFLGEGFYGQVYKIDDKYVAKIDTRRRINLDELDKLQDTSSTFFDKLKTYYGEPLINLEKQIVVLKNVSSNGKHTNAGVPKQITSAMTYGEQLQYWNEKYLPVFANLPQKSFDNLAKDFATLNTYRSGSIYYSFDTKNPNNAVLVGKNSLRIVDDINKTYTKNENTTAALLRLFVEKIDLDYLVEKDITNETLIKELTKKIILAGEKHELPLCTLGVDLKTWQHVCGDYCNIREIIEGLEKIRKKTPNTQERLEKAEKLLDTIMSQTCHSHYYYYY